jgi:low affinity Fe/Cu permease
VVVIMIWVLTGPIFHFSDTWQLAINTGTTIITFWMVFVIQNSANRQAQATQLKLDEIIRALDPARNELMELDKASETVLAEREHEFEQLAEDATGPGSDIERTVDEAAASRIKAALPAGTRRRRQSGAHRPRH